MELTSNILTIMGISLIVFLSSLFFRNISNTKSNILLILILFSFIPIFLSYNLTLLKDEKLILSFIPFTTFSLLIIGPLLYEYSFHFFSVDKSPLFNKNKNYAPAFIVAILQLIAYAICKKEYLHFFLIICLSFSFLYLLYYLLKLTRYQVKSISQLKYYYSDLSNKNLIWINIFIVGLFLVLILDSISGAITLISGFQEMPLINSLFLLLLVWFLGYNGLIQKRLIQNVEEIIAPQNEPLNDLITEDISEPKNEPIETDICESEEYQILKNELVKILEEKEIYKLENVTLRVLSQHLNVSSKKVSILLNQCMNTTFYDLMNYYRLTEFKNRIKKGEANQKTILAIAFESGFNSKATFNRIFKLKEGMTPKEYVKSQI